MSKGYNQQEIPSQALSAQKQFFRFVLDRKGDYSAENFPRNIL
jgi:hypothetical protein